MCESGHKRAATIVLLVANGNTMSRKQTSDEIPEAGTINRNDDESESRSPMVPLGKKPTDDRSGSRC